MGWSSFLPLLQFGQVPEAALITLIGALQRNIAPLQFAKFSQRRKLVGIGGLAARALACKEALDGRFERGTSGAAARLDDHSRLAFELLLPCREVLVKA